MSTPVIGITPTAVVGDNLNLSGFGAESGDVEAFEQVLHELLDTEGDHLGVLISPHPLPPSPTAWEKATVANPHPLTPSPMAWERESPTCFSHGVGEGLGVRAIITAPHLLASLEQGMAPEFKNLASFTDFSNLTLLPPLSVYGEGGSAALPTPCSPSPTAWQGGAGGESASLNEPSASTGLGQPANAPDRSAQASALPVPSARQGETPPAPETPALGSVEIPPVEGGAPEPKRQVRSEPAPSERNAAPAHPVPLSAHHASVAAQVDAPHGTRPEPLADPNWRVAEQMAQHIERMVYDCEREAITVRLDPPELGVIELRVQTTGNEVHAWVNAERDLTRQLLQQAQQHLREQLESRGLELAHFDVGGQSHSQFAQARPLRTPATQSVAFTYPSTATDSLNYDGRWSVWV